MGPRYCWDPVAVVRVEVLDPVLFFALIKARFYV